MKKLLAVLLSLCLVVGMLPMMAFATDDLTTTPTTEPTTQETTETPPTKSEGPGQVVPGDQPDPGSHGDPGDPGDGNQDPTGDPGYDADNIQHLEELQKALQAKVSTIKLGATMGLSENLAINYNVTIIGGGDSQPSFTGTGSLSIAGNVSFENVGIQVPVMVSDGATLNLSSNCNIDGATFSGTGTVVQDGVTIYPKDEPETPPIQPLRYSVEFDVNPYWANASIVVEDESGNVVKPNGNGEYWLEAGELYYYIVRANGFNDAVGNIDADYAWDTITVNLSLNGPIVVWPYSHGYVEYWISHSRDWAGVRVEPDSGYYLDDLTIYKVGGGTVNYGHWRDNIYYFPLYAGEQYIIDADFASAPSEYRVYVDSSILHGDVSVDTVYAEEGEWVYITVDPDVGYRLYNLTVTRPSGNTVKVEHVRDNVYRFSMPGVRVTVDAEFIRTVTPFTDVRLADWFYEYVSFAYRYGLMEGINSYQFAPDATATRAMVVQILYRMSGEPAVSYGSGFTDVASNAWYADAIAWAARNNIVNGTSAATFDPNAPVTREQFATMLYRYARYRGFNTSLTANILSYYDVNQVSEYAFEALQWACAEGIVNGTSTGYLTPQGNATRAQLAAMLMRFCNEYFDL